MCVCVGLCPPQGQLYLLVTDQGFLTEEKVVWESLHNVDGDGNFCDSEFRLRPPSDPETVYRGQQDQIDQVGTHKLAKARLTWWLPTWRPCNKDTEQCYSRQQTRKEVCVSAHLPSVTADCAMCNSLMMTSSSLASLLLDSLSCRLIDLLIDSVYFDIQNHKWGKTNLKHKTSYSKRIEKK